MLYFYVVVYMLVVGSPEYGLSAEVYERKFVNRDSMTVFIDNMPLVYSNVQIDSVEVKSADNQGRYDEYNRFFCDSKWLRKVKLDLRRAERKKR